MNPTNKSKWRSGKDVCERCSMIFSLHPSAIGKDCMHEVCKKCGCGYSFEWYSGDCVKYQSTCPSCGWNDDCGYSNKGC